LRPPAIQIRKRNNELKNVGIQVNGKKNGKNEGRERKKCRPFQTALHFGSELSYGSKFSYLPSYRSTQDQIQKNKK
jgi:hypothetical protein